MGRCVIRFLILLVVFNSGLACPADVFVLTGGGRISGELVNRNETPRKQYVIQVAGQGRVTLDASQVDQVIYTRPDEQQYEKIRPDYPDTVEGQWALAEWCREHKLNVERDAHLERIIELDPSHAEARRALGYAQIEGQWVTQDELMIQRGYKRYKGRWMLPQQIELLEDKSKLENVQQEWFQKVKRWRGWLGTNRDEQARENLHNIADPAAVKALVSGLRDDPSDSARLLYIEALAKINTLEAAKALAIASIDDPVEELRLTCLDFLQKQDHPEVITYYVSKLRAKDNLTINLAAIGLGRLKDPSTIGPLIDALITTHKFKISKPSGDDSITTTFSNAPGGGGFSFGGGPKIISRQFNNQAVLDALVAITGQNFNYNQADWRHWYASQKKPEAIDARRD
ncbi:MAG TPA: HEAT repeat domain-containing protein [Thermoguttaceae bacterium]